MPGMTGAIGAGCQELDAAALATVLDPVGAAAPSVWRGGEAFVCHSRLGDAPLSGALHSAGGVRGWFAGDLPGVRTVPWDLIGTALRDGHPGGLADLHGPFAAVLHEEATGRTWLASDRRGQQPLFYAVENGMLLFSTAAASFCRLRRPPAFAPEWLYEFLYFNHPVLETTFLQGVRRLPPASVLSWDPAAGRATVESYAAPFARPVRLAEGREGLELAREVFGRAAAECFDSPAPTAVALTAGFDSRSVLAFAPPPGTTDLLAYTYGVPGSYDLVEAGAAARRLRVPHLEIPFDRGFVSRLPALIHDTVRLSDGLERVLRGSLSHVFATLRGQGRAVAVTGVSGDHLFRDHLRGQGNVPSLISPDMMRHIQGGDDGIDDPTYLEALGRRHADFAAHVRGRLRMLEERHGKLGAPEGYVRYLVYENAPKYFGGEAALAGTRLTYRTPYWDSRVVRMAFGVAQGTLGLSERLPGKDRFLECSLQGHLVRRSAHYGKAPIKGASPSSYARGNRLLYRLDRLLRQGPGRLARFGRRRSMPPLENWEGWFSDVLAEEIRRLLGAESRLAAHVRPQALAEALQSGDLQWVGKLVTAEILLRLVENGWNPIDTATGERP